MEKLNRIREYFSDSRKIVICFFVLVFVTGIVFAADYGMSYDYRSESEILFTNIKYIGEKFLGEGSLDNAWLMRGLPNLETFKERDHGKAMYYPFALFRLIVKPGAQSTQFAMNAYTFCINFMGLVFLYKTAVFLFKRRRYGIIAALFWILSPRILADSFYNEKDMVFASLVIASIYFSFSLIDKPCIKHAVWLSVFTGFACNTRILGLFFPFLALIAYCAQRTKNQEWNKKTILIPVFTVIGSLAVMFIVTPAMWSGMIDYFTYNVGSSADFSRWNGYVYYLGELYNHSTNPLPWHYLPTIFFMTTPFIIFIFIIVGIFMSCKGKNTAILLIFAAFPPVFAVLNHSNIYNGWRHFFFIYPPLLLLATGAVKYFLENKKTKNAAVFLLMVQFISSSVWIAVNHPHEYVYYNFLSKSQAQECDLDYWNISAAECLEKCARSDGGKFTIAASDLHSENALINAIDLLPDKYRDNVTMLYIDGKNSADYIMVNPTYYHIAEETDESFIPIDLSRYSVYTEIKCDDIPIMTIYKAVDSQ